jgi:hypothetical protein
MVGHWPGFYFAGQEVGFRILQEVVARLHARYDNLVWMKPSEIARYWAAKELTRIDQSPGAVDLTAPLAAPNFTLSIATAKNAVPELVVKDNHKPLKEVAQQRDLKPGTWLRARDRLLVCFDLPKGKSQLRGLT